MFGFTVPNNVEANYPQQAQVHQSDLHIMMLGTQYWGVISGCEPSTGGSMDIDVPPGEIAMGDHVREVAGGTVTLNDGHATQARFDYVFFDSDGVLGVAEGDAAAYPYKPTWASTFNGVVVAEIYVPATTTTIIGDMITDKRVFVREMEDTRFFAPNSASLMCTWFEGLAVAWTDLTADIGGGL